MGLFSSLFGSGKNEQTSANKAAVDRTPPLPALSKGLRLVINTKDGKQIMDGRLASFSGSSLTLERAPGQISLEICKIGDEVFIRGFASNSAPFDMTGVVEESSRIVCRIRNLKTVTHNELRGGFRLPISAPITAYYPEDEKLQNPEQCTLVNLSVGGACFQSEFIHGEGERLRLKIQLEDYAPMVFYGEILRVEEPKPGVFRYGFLFAQLDEREASALTRMLFNVQVGSRKEWRRSYSDGHWF